MSWISWTPEIQGSTSTGTATYSRQVGEYLVEGDKVTVTFVLTWSGHTGTGNMMVGTLPQAPVTTAGLRFVAPCLTNIFSYPSLTSSVICQVAGDVNTNQLFVQGVGSGSVAAVVPMAAAGQLNSTIVYHI